MKDILLVRILPVNETLGLDAKVQWGVYSRAGELSGEVHVSELGQLKNDWGMQRDGLEAEEDKVPDKVILLLSGNLTINRQLELNSGQRKHINTALPYLIEEDLAEDIDNIHIGSFLHRKGSGVSLVAIPHKDMQVILSLFDQIALPPDHIYSECQLLSAPDETASMVLDTHSVAMAAPKHATLALDYEAVPFALAQRVAAIEEKSSALEEVADERVSQVTLICPSGPFTSSSDKAETLKNWLGSQGWLFQEEVLPGSVFEFFATQYFQFYRSGELIDLRHGPYQCPRRASRRMKQWRPLIIMIACWLVVEFGIMLGQGIYFGSQADELWNQNAELYLSVFPQDRQVRDAKARNQRTFNLQTWLENRLKHSGKMVGKGGEPFLPLLQRISAIAVAQGKEAAIVPQGMDFNDESGHLMLEFQASSLEVVNKLMADLKAEGLQTNLDSANQDKVGVIARMTVAR